MYSLVNCEFLIYRQRIEQDELDRVMEACDMVRIHESVYVYNIPYTQISSSTGLRVE